MPDAEGMPTEAEWLEGNYRGAREEHEESGPMPEPTPIDASLAGPKDVVSLPTPVPDAGEVLAEFMESTDQLQREAGERPGPWKARHAYLLVEALLVGNEHGVTIRPDGSLIPASPDASLSPAPPGWPDGFEMIRQLREALGLFAGALPVSPKEAWEEAIGLAVTYRTVAEPLVVAVSEHGDVLTNDDRPLSPAPGGRLSAAIEALRFVVEHAHCPRRDSIYGTGDATPCGSCHWCVASAALDRLSASPAPLPDDEEP